MANTPHQNEPDSTGAAADTAGLEALARALRISFGLLILAMIVGVLVFLKRSVFEVQNQEKGLVLRFGAIHGDPLNPVLEPGAHFTLPEPIDEKIAVPVGREQQVATVDWFMPLENPEVQPATLAPGPNGYTLTGDMNIIHSRWTMWYTITDPQAYAFTVYDSSAPAVDDPDARGKNPEMERLLACLLRNAVIRATSSMAVDDAWRNRDGEFTRRVEEQLRADSDRLKLGIDVKRVTLESGSAAPPNQAAGAFTAVTRAEEERRRLLSDAQTYATRSRNTAVTDANRVVNEAVSYRDDVTNSVAAEAENFRLLLTEYRKNPGIISQTLYEDTMRRILASTDKKFIVQDAEGQQVRINLESPKKKKSGAND